MGVFRGALAPLARSLSNTLLFRRLNAYPWSSLLLISFSKPTQDESEPSSLCIWIKTRTRHPLFAHRIPSGQAMTVHVSKRTVYSVRVYYRLGFSAACPLFKDLLILRTWGKWHHHTAPRHGIDRNRQVACRSVGETDKGQPDGYFYHKIGA